MWGLLAECAADPDEQDSQDSDRIFQIYFYKKTYEELWLAYSQTASGVPNYNDGA